LGRAKGEVADEALRRKLEAWLGSAFSIERELGGGSKSPARGRAVRKRYAELVKQEGR
jgi:hypothetical protein